MKKSSESEERPQTGQIGLELLVAEASFSQRTAQNHASGNFSTTREIMVVEGTD